MSETLGEFLKTLRNQAGHSMQRLADQIETSTSFINNVEHNHTKLPPERIASWAGALDADPVEIGIRALRLQTDEFCVRAGLHDRIAVTIKRKGR